MKYFLFGRVTPERANVSFTSQTWRAKDGHAITAVCEASQLCVTVELPNADRQVDAFIEAEHVTDAIVSSLGFALGSGYGVDIIQLVTETGQTHVLGVRPDNLLFPEHLPVFTRSCDLAKRDVYFRLALRDYVRAVTDVLDCAHYCFRAIEALSASFQTPDGAEGWSQLHAALGTTRDEIDTKIKAFADATRHGNWREVKPSTSSQRFDMLLVTRDMLKKYLDYRSPPTSA